MRRVLVVLAGIAVICAAACDRTPPSAGLPEWTAGDHDHQLGEPTGKVGPRAAPGTAEEAPKSMADITWRNQCSACHGMGGHGDGPQGPMLKATDLSSEEWQSKVQDQDIANAIKNGKGKMPKFDLPDDVIAGLVVRVRATRGK